MFFFVIYHVLFVCFMITDIVFYCQNLPKSSNKIERVHSLEECSIDIEAEKTINRKIIRELLAKDIHTHNV